MRIVQIVPGSGGSFYCENCLRDVDLVKELRRQGHEVTMVPMYLPLFDDAPGIAGDTPVFFGGINTYLQQNFSLFRKTPRWLDSAFDTPGLLKFLAKRASSVRSRDLGEMTISMLRGADGRQAKEVKRLVSWLAEEEKPDVIHLSNALLVGLVSTLKERLSVPVVCSLQDEGDWIDGMAPPWNDRCWAAIAGIAPNIDAFASVSQFYADTIGPLLRIPEDKLHVLPIGVDLEGFEQSSLPADPPVIGYLARMAECLGLDILVDAFLLLKKHPELSKARLVITGGRTGDDDSFLDDLRGRIADAGLSNDVDFVDDFARAARQQTLRSLTAFCVPSRDDRAFGLFLLEAMACGVPVIAPKAGAFPEVIDATGGGIVYDPNTPEALADQLVALLTDHERAASLGQAGRDNVRELFSVEGTAGKLVELYEGLKGNG